MYAATTKDEGNAADGRFSAACRKKETSMTILDVVGKREPMLDAADKATGRADSRTILPIRGCSTERF